MFTIDRESKWEFLTSNTTNIGGGPSTPRFGVFGGFEGGSIFLKDPRGNMDTLTYGTFGGGGGIGISLPKVGSIGINNKSPYKGTSLSGNIGPAAMPNMGKIYMTDSFKGKELDEDDLKGVCFVAEVSAGVIGGVSGTAMFMGMDTDSMGPDLFQLVSPLIYGVLDAAGVWDNFEHSCKAVLVTAGTNFGLQAGASIGEYIGYVG